MKWENIVFNSLIYSTQFHSRQFYFICIVSAKELVDINLLNFNRTPVHTLYVLSLVFNFFVTLGLPVLIP